MREFKALQLFSSRRSPERVRSRFFLVGTQLGGPAFLVNCRQVAVFPIATGLSEALARDEILQLA